MNRDSGPYFSLGISQLESIKEYEEVVNFVPGSFDYEFIGFDENRSKHRNDPHTMKKLREKYAKKDKKKEIHVSKKRGSNSSGGKTPAKRRRVVEGLSYIIKKIPPHHLRFGSSCNLKFKDEIKEVVGQEVIDLFETTIFGCYLNIPLSNYIGKITKCLLMLEIEQPNQEEMHVCVKGNILRFSIYEFALITGLKCFGNVEDFKHDDFSPSRLMRRYFPQSTNGVDKEALVKRFLKDNFKTIEDALQMAILYFIYSQLNASPILFFDFKMVEDRKYKFFPWGQVSFSRLMASLRQNFF
ncbi:uncharacterized protein LOC124897034 [Capsicum annuum]|uniref:uncharacterized protein LOC124897034 n=1 Tax=Capsicum annuum TaxID=4072 RepID=UPI001FB0F96F|nr:uncharacterized protein LOC124897034 [Capsicum annuum]